MLRPSTISGFEKRMKRRVRQDNGERTCYAGADEAGDAQDAIVGTDCCGVPDREDDERYHVVRTSLHRHVALWAPSREQSSSPKIHARTEMDGRPRLNQFPADRVRHGLESVVRAKLLIDVMEVIPERLGANLELTRDVDRALPVGEVAEHLMLLLRQRVHRGGRSESSAISTSSFDTSEASTGTSTGPSSRPWRSPQSSRSMQTRSNRRRGGCRLG